ncbi:thiol reductant ABC exporter subunit CydD [Diaphorobacter sp. HDW4A]|uniref:thiol reductant ABC exporter subunit CydD n=1 Tax=Diaphorobacter sp. HDW4A TaxID=2714924 RepID=UPI00140D6FE4|nr:thiol reductant ABC exporter subunit CydD [Diaphorobacter sp. HDW4A]QIL83684.1 thiol reductant ABC exporter subunit CydD [Diaphorobacter sp. HDW4A]
MLQMLAALLWLPQAWWIAQAVQVMAAGGVSLASASSSAQAGGVLAQVLPLVLGVLAVGVLRAVLDGAGVLRAQMVAREQLSRLRGQVIHAIAKASPMDRAQAPSGQVASAMAEQAEAIVPWLSRYQTAMFKVRCVPLVFALAVGYFSWVAAFILLIAAPLIPVFMAIVGWRARSASEEQMVEIGGMNGFLLDRLRGLSTLRALGAIDATVERLRAHAESLRERTMRVLRIAFLSSAVLELFSALGVAMVAVYVGFHLLGTLHFGAWGGKLELSQALFVLMLAPAFFDPLRELSAVWHDKASGEAALKTLDDVQRQAVAVVGVEHGAKSLREQPSRCAVSVEIDALQVGVPGHAVAIAELNLHVAAGEHVALWAPSGAGKSVLLAQLAGLIASERGSIYIDGEALGEDTASALRSRMAWMGQQTHVFASSVQRNVVLGRAAVSADAVIRAVELAALAQMFADHPVASLGEGGSGLSGGEVVRLALARLAVNEQAGLLLVDEPTAHLDPETSEQVTEGLLQIAKGRTLIVATHDPRLALRMDRVIRLKEGA